MTWTPLGLFLLPVNPKVTAIESRLCSCWAWTAPLTEAEMNRRHLGSVIVIILATIVFACTIVCIQGPGMSTATFPLDLGFLIVDVKVGVGAWCGHEALRVVSKNVARIEDVLCMRIRARSLRSAFRETSLHGASYRRQQWQL
jgi:hypothetical protein